MSILPHRFFFLGLIRLNKVSFSPESDPSENLFFPLCSVRKEFLAATILSGFAVWLFVGVISCLFLYSPRPKAHVGVSPFFSLPFPFPPNEKRLTHKGFRSHLRRVSFCLLFIFTSLEQGLERSRSFLVFCSFRGAPLI